MAHKTKKMKEKQKYRGDTFVGFRPVIEPSKKERIRKQEEKHK